MRLIRWPRVGSLEKTQSCERTLQQHRAGGQKGTFLPSAPEVISKMATSSGESSSWHIPSGACHESKVISAIKERSWLKPQEPQKNVSILPSVFPAHLACQGEQYLAVPCQAKAPKSHSKPINTSDEITILILILASHPHPTNA